MIKSFDPVEKAHGINVVRHLNRNIMLQAYFTHLGNFSDPKPAQFLRLVFFKEGVTVKSDRSDYLSGNLNPAGLANQIDGNFVAKVKSSDGQNFETAFQENLAGTAVSGSDTTCEDAALTPPKNAAVVINSEITYAKETRKYYVGQLQEVLAKLDEGFEIDEAAEVREMRGLPVGLVSGALEREKQSSVFGVSPSLTPVDLGRDPIPIGIEIGATKGAKKGGLLASVSKVAPLPDIEFENFIELDIAPGSDTPFTLSDVSKADPVGWATETRQLIISRQRGIEAAFNNKIQDLLEDAGITADDGFHFKALLNQFTQAGVIEIPFLTEFEDAGRDIIKNYIFPYIVLNAQLAAIGSPSGAMTTKSIEKAIRFVKNPATAEDVFALKQADGQVDVLRNVIGIMFRKLNGSPMSKVQIDTLKKFETSFRGKQSAYITLGAGGGKTFLSSIADELLNLNESGMKVVHMAPFPNTEDSWGHLTTLEELVSDETPKHLWITVEGFVNLMGQLEALENPDGRPATKGEKKLASQAKAVLKNMLAVMDEFVDLSFYVPVNSSGNIDPGGKQIHLSQYLAKFGSQRHVLMSATPDRARDQSLLSMNLLKAKRLLKYAGPTIDQVGQPAFLRQISDFLTDIIPMINIPDYDNGNVASLLRVTRQTLQALEDHFEGITPLSSEQLNGSLALLHASLNPILRLEVAENNIDEIVGLIDPANIRLHHTISESVGETINELIKNKDERASSHSYSVNLSGARFGTKDTAIEIDTKLLLSKVETLVLVRERTAAISVVITLLDGRKEGYSLIRKTSPDLTDTQPTKWIKANTILEDVSNGIDANHPKPDHLFNIFSTPMKSKATKGHLVSTSPLDRLEALIDAPLISTLSPASAITFDASEMGIENGKSDAPGKMGKRDVVDMMMRRMRELGMTAPFSVVFGDGKPKSKGGGTNPATVYTCYLDDNGKYDFQSAPLDLTGEDGINPVKGGSYTLNRRTKTLPPATSVFCFFTDERGLSSLQTLPTNSPKVLENDSAKSGLQRSLASLPQHLFEGSKQTVNVDLRDSFLHVDKDDPGHITLNSLKSTVLDHLKSIGKDEAPFSISVTGVDGRPSIHTCIYDDVLRENVWLTPQLSSATRAGGLEAHESADIDGINYPATDLVINITTRADAADATKTGKDMASVALRQVSEKSFISGEPNHILIQMPDCALHQSKTDATHITIDAIQSVIQSRMEDIGMDDKPFSILIRGTKGKRMVYTFHDGAWLTPQVYKGDDDLGVDPHKGPPKVDNVICFYTTDSVGGDFDDYSAGHIREQVIFYGKQHHSRDIYQHLRRNRSDETTNPISIVGSFKPAMSTEKDGTSLLLNAKTMDAELSYSDLKNLYQTAAKSSIMPAIDRLLALTGQSEDAGLKTTLTQVMIKFIDDRAEISPSNIHLVMDELRDALLDVLSLPKGHAFTLDTTTATSETETQVANLLELGLILSKLDQARKAGGWGTTPFAVLDQLAPD
ncbi:MAG: hypothetical protein ACI9BD_001123, partial [Candidatus Marinamargulisbacteria bacterium]